MSSIKNNIFTVKLHDVVVVPKGRNAQKEILFDDIFLVQEYFGMDFTQFFENITAGLIGEEHIKMIMYNLLSSVNFLHQTGVIHRDLKPANVLID